MRYGRLQKGTPFGVCRKCTSGGTPSNTFALRKRLLTLWPRKRPSTRTCPAAAAAGGGAALAAAVAAVAVAAGGGVGGTAVAGAVLAAAAGGVAAGGGTRSRACTECGLVGAQGVTASFCLHGYCWWNVGACVGRGLTGVSQRVSGASVWMGWLAAWRRGVRVEAAGGNRCVFGRGGTGCVRYVSTCASLARGNDTGALDEASAQVGGCALCGGAGVSSFPDGETCTAAVVAKLPRPVSTYPRSRPPRGRYDCTLGRGVGSQGDHAGWGPPNDV